MAATPRNHPPAPLRLVESSPVRHRPHRSAAVSPASSGVLDPSGVDPSGRFVLTVRALADAAREQGLRVPNFQSPPRSEQHDRTILRSSDGGCVVAVRVRGRPFAAVVADAIEGIVVYNELDAAAAAVVRDELWRSIEGSHTAAAGPLASAPRADAVGAPDIPCPLGEAA